MNVSKIVFVGDQYVGKTTLIKRILNDTVIPIYRPTLGVVLRTWDCKQLWELGGVNTVITNEYAMDMLNKVSVVAYVVDAERDQTIAHLEQWRQQIIDLYKEPPKEIVIVNKIESSKSLNIDTIISKIPDTLGHASLFFTSVKKNQLDSLQQYLNNI